VPHPCRRPRSRRCSAARRREMQPPLWLRRRTRTAWARSARGLSRCSEASRSRSWRTFSRERAQQSKAKRSCRHSHACALSGQRCVGVAASALGLLRVLTRGYSEHSHVC
jgi:hypothetical protein